MMKTLTDLEKARLWYIVATQALHELGRPLLLDKGFANKVVKGETAIYSKRISDEYHLYKVI